MASYAVGSDGSVTFPTGFNAVLNTWSATMTRATHVLTGYGATVHNRRASAVIDITGSAGGIPKYWDGTATGADNSFSPIAHTDGSGNFADAGDLGDRAGGNITLRIAPGSGNDCELTFGAVFSSYALTATNDGDSAITFNFEMNDGDGPAATWDETA
jgi:hypothetical protein